MSQDSQDVYPTCHEQYCEGDCIYETKSNFCEYMTNFITNGPEPTTNRMTRDAMAATEVCNCLTTACCLPFKCVAYVPLCPAYILCPNVSPGPCASNLIYNWVV